MLDRGSCTIYTLILKQKQECRFGCANRAFYHTQWPSFVLCVQIFLEFHYLYCYFKRNELLHVLKKHVVDILFKETI